jgi:aminopeptidase N
LHQETAQQDARQLVDENNWEGTIAHELFHQWFGDYVTAESWSNLTVNESFADYSQLLWEEYKHGADAAGFEQFKEMQSYLTSGTSGKDLVRFYYNDKEDMFDQVSYQKGGRILHMLRNYVGDQAFFASLNKYLTTNKLGNGSAHKLRLAFEEVTGKDLNWFFNQWYFGNGHPKLEINYGYDSAAHIANVYVKQTQTGDKIFRLPMAIDIYYGAQKTRHQVWANNKVDTFSFAALTRPDLINVDGDKVILADKRDNKTLAEFIHQYNYAGKYLDRREAVDFASKKLSDPAAYQLHIKALSDPYDRIRAKAIQGLNLAKLDAAAYSKLETIAKNDPKRLVRAEAIDLLSKSNDKAYKDLYLSATTDSSYSVAGAGLLALSTVDSVLAYKIAIDLSKQPSKGRLIAAISNVIIKLGDESAYDYIMNNFTGMPLSQEKFSTVASVADFLAKLTNPQKFEKGVDEIVKFRDDLPGQIRVQTDPYINNMILKGLATKKEKAGAKAMADYVNSKIAQKK